MQARREINAALARVIGKVVLSRGKVVHVALRHGLGVIAVAEGHALTIGLEPEARAQVRDLLAARDPDRLHEFDEARRRLGG